jgi:hypothetical protein
VAALRSKVSRLRREVDALGLTFGCASDSGTHGLRVDVDAHHGRVHTGLENKPVNLGSIPVGSREPSSKQSRLDAGIGRHVGLGVGTDLRESSRANAGQDNAAEEGIAGTAHGASTPHECAQSYCARTTHSRKNTDSDPGSQMLCSEPYSGKYAVSVSESIYGDDVSTHGGRDAAADKGSDQRVRGDPIALCAGMHDTPIGIEAGEVESVLAQVHGYQPDVDLEELD